MDVAVIVASAISMVVQVMLLRHKVLKRRFEDLMWDVPVSVTAVYLGMQSGANGFAAMMIASNLISISLLLTRNARSTKR